jgi:hypothetical protein
MTVTSFSGHRSGIIYTCHCNLEKGKKKNIPEGSHGSIRRKEKKRAAFNAALGIFR